MNLAALPIEVEQMWWWTLAIGLLVAIVVAVLLHALYAAVRRIERNAETLWYSATTVARNTATTWMLAETAELAADLKKEAIRHDDFLSKGRKR